MKVLVVEDDKIILEGLRYSLLGEGYEAVTACSVKDAVEILEKDREIAFCLLDIMLPDGTGYEICRKIREKSKMPILFLTACDDEVNTVMALELGADDYIAKPFRVRELMARMKAILRRTGEYQEQEALTEIGRFTLNLKTGKLYDKETEVVLTAMEYKLLLVFLNHRGQILTRQQILGCLWDEVGDFVNDNTLSVYIKRLRAKLEDENNLIQTVRGIGYRMEALP